MIGTVTDFVDGTTVLDSAGNVVGILDGATGNVVDSAGNVIGALDPLTGQVLDAAGNLVGTVGEVLDDVTDTLGQLDTGDLLKGDLLNVDVNVDLDADLAAPINGAVAANANVAAPIDAVRGGQHPVRGLRVDRDRPAGRDHHPVDHRERGGDLRPGLQHRPGRPSSRSTPTPRRPTTRPSDDTATVPLRRRSEPASDAAALRSPLPMPRHAGAGSDDGTVTDSSTP